MREQMLNIWDYAGQEGYIICLTTNGTLKRNGQGVMGRGVAAQAKERIPGLAKHLGFSLQVYGNQVVVWEGSVLPYAICYCPVKHQWWQRADLALIRQSAETLADIALRRSYRDRVFLLPRPGCGNGGRDWQSEVRPLLLEANLPDNVWLVEWRSIGDRPKVEG